MKIKTERYINARINYKLNFFFQWKFLCNHRNDKFQRKKIAAENFLHKLGCAGIELAPFFASLTELMNFVSLNNLFNSQVFFNH